MLPNDGIEIKAAATTDAGASKGGQINGTALDSIRFARLLVRYNP
jgi:hypothetical protein